jgi:hypothetical protein
MEPSVLFDYCHFRRCDVELAEQRLGLLDQLRHRCHRRYRLYLLLLVPGYTPVWPGIVGPVFWVLATIFSTIAPTGGTKGATRGFTGHNNRT